MSAAPVLALGSEHAPRDRESGILPTSLPAFDWHTIEPGDYRYVEREGARPLVRAENFHVLPLGSSSRKNPPRKKPPVSARPRGSSVAGSKWLRSVTALGRFVEGRCSYTEVVRARAHERGAISYRRVHCPVIEEELGSYIPKRDEDKRKRPGAKSKLTSTPPTFTPNELANAAAIIGKQCKGPLLERAWLELKYPPEKRTKPVTSFEQRVSRAIERARRKLREDCCRQKLRVPLGTTESNDGEPKINLGGRAGTFDADD